MAALRNGIERVTQAGFPSGFACVYDEFYRMFGRLQGVLTPILGPDHVMVMNGIWLRHVPVNDPAYRVFSARGPHRDGLGAPDPRVLARDTPTIASIWIPLSDATPLTSCIYVVPAPYDPDYFTTELPIRRAKIRLQDTRAVPAAAGSVLCWTTHLLHWGSRSAPRAAADRFSAEIYFQRGDVPALDDSRRLSDPISFNDRLRWIEVSMRNKSAHPQFDFL